jgi:hypothetical protein
MFIRVANTRLLVVPLAAFFLLFTGGAAFAPDCHIESTSQTTINSVAAHNHSAAPHSHSHQSPSAVASNAQETVIASGGALNNEICFIVGFIVLLLLRYSHLKRSILKVTRIPRPRYFQPLCLSKNLGYLNLTHLKLGIIRI